MKEFEKAAEWFENRAKTTPMPGARRMFELAAESLREKAIGVTVQEWISVDERLPEKGEYLVAYHPCLWDHVEYDKVCIGMDTFRGKTTWAKNKYRRVTHWMPMPEAPNEIENKHATQKASEE